MLILSVLQSGAHDIIYKSFLPLRSFHRCINVLSACLYVYVSLCVCVNNWMRSGEIQYAEFYFPLSMHRDKPFVFRPWRLCWHFKVEMRRGSGDNKAHRILILGIRSIRVQHNTQSGGNVALLSL